MTLRNYQIPTLILLSILLFSVPWITSAASFIQDTIWGIVVAFFGLFLGLAGYLLDSAINDYVIGFGKAFTTSGVGLAVDNLWYAVRDIFNLTFIFGLVFIGFKMILDSDDSNTRRWLVNLIMAALLVNFSLFITKFVIDFSNIIATQIAHALPVDPKAPDNVSVSHGFMNALGLQSTLGVKHGDIPGGIEGNGAYGFIFGTMIMFIVMTFVFAAGGFMLLIRYAALCLYMVLSPLMFLGWVFPQLEGITSSYWKGFLGRAFFAPIYLLLVYFSYFVLAALYHENSLGGKDPDYIKAMTGGGDSIGNSFGGTFPPFILTCIFLIASIVVGNKMSNDAAGMGGKVNAWTQGKVKQYMRSGYRTAASQTGGRLARRSSYALGNKLNDQINRMQAKGGITGKIARTNGVDEIARGGAGKLQGAKFGLGKTVDQETEKTRSINKGVRDRADAEENEHKLMVAQAGYETAAAAAKEANIPEDQRTAAAKMRDEYDDEVKMRAAKLTEEQVSAMKEANIKRVNRHLSDKQLEAYYDATGGMFERKTPQEQLTEAKEGRSEIFEKHTTVLKDTARSADELAAATKELADTVKSLSEERLKGMNIDQLKDPSIAIHLSDDQIKTLGSSGNFSASNIKTIKTARETALNTVITEGTLVDKKANPAAKEVKYQEGQRKNIFANRSIADVGKLPVSIFTNENSFEHLTPAMIEARLKNGAEGKEEAIRTALAKHLKVNPADLKTKLKTDPALQNTIWSKWLQNDRNVWSQQFFA